MLLRNIALLGATTPARDLGLLHLDQPIRMARCRDREVYRPSLPREIGDHGDQQQGGPIGVRTLEARRAWMRKCIEPLTQTEGDRATEAARQAAARDQRRRFAERLVEGTQT